MYSSMRGISVCNFYSISLFLQISKSWTKKMKLRGQQGWCDNVVASMLVGYIVWHFMIFFSLSLFIDLQSLVKNRKFDLMRICNHVEKTM